METQVRGHRPRCCRRGAGATWVATLVLGMLVSGCAAGPRGKDPCGFMAGCGDLREVARKSQAQQHRQLRQETAQPEVGGTRSAGAFGTGALTPYLEFIRDREERLKAAEPGPRQLEQRVLWDLHLWALSQSEAALRQRTPLEVYAELKAQRQEQERREAQRQAAVEARLEEYWQWALARWEQTSRERVRRIAPRHLLTEHPLRTQSLDALTGAVLDWAFTHTRDEALLHKSPSEVALYLLARRSSLATAVELGRFAPPHLDYTPPAGQAHSSRGVGGGVAAGHGARGGRGHGRGRPADGLQHHRPRAGRQRAAAVRGGRRWFPSCRAELCPPAASGWSAPALLTGRSLEEVQVLQRVAAT